MMPPFRSPEHQSSTETNKKQLGIGTFLIIVLILMKITASFSPKT